MVLRPVGMADGTAVLPVGSDMSEILWFIRAKCLDLVAGKILWEGLLDRTSCRMSLLAKL
jgi:hypothetical protein